MKGCCECEGDKLFSTSLVNNLQNGLKRRWEIQKRKIQTNKQTKAQLNNKNHIHAHMKKLPKIYQTGKSLTNFLSLADSYFLADT